MQYRPEIDGLRSIAVLPVLFYHAGFSWIPGGFIGVDIFFVISGYLITKIILEEINNRKFSLLGFYSRRVRRILPALIAVVLASLIGALVFALPSQLEQVAVSAVAALFSVSNFYFWQQSGYFSPSTDFMPLLHTWSLGVEEQFYIVFPFLVLLFLKVRFNFGIALIAALPLLFALSLWLSFNKPSVAFYLLPARAWELVLGALLAIGIIPILKSRAVNEVISLAGLAAILFGIFWITSAQIFPGYIALLPCLGAAAIIHCSNRSTFVGQLLAVKPMLFVGLISYSLYLWHWPVIVFLRMHFAQVDLSSSLAFAAVLVCFPIAAMSWYFVERPFRRADLVPTRRFAATMFSASAMVFGLVTFSALTDGWQNRLNTDVASVLSASKDFDPMHETCLEFRVAGRDGECSFGREELPVSYVILGDSHAGAIRPAFEAASSFSDTAGTLWSMGGCPFLLGAERVPDRDHASCNEFREEVLEALQNAPEIETVVIVNRWAPIWSGILPEVGGSYRIELVDSYSERESSIETRAVFRRSLDRTVETISQMGKEVVLVSGLMEPGFDVPTLLALNMLNRNASGEVEIRHEDALESDNHEISALLADVALANSSVRSISIRSAFCDPDCKILADGVPLFRDDDHITATAAKTRVARVIDDELSSGEGN